MNNRINEIDLLRFIGAFIVLLYHYTFRGYGADNMSIIAYPLFAPFTKYGYLGVNLFFMISGFVILMSASSGSLKKFTISRLIRLYPAFWIASSLTFVMTLWIGETHFHLTLLQYLENLTMISGFIGVEPLDGVYWTLLVEIRFYLLVALILWLSKIEYIEFFLALWLILSISVVLFPIKLLAQIFIVNYAGYFIAGSIYFLIYQNGLTLNRMFMLMISLALVLFVSTTHTIPTDEKHYHLLFNATIINSIISSFFVIMMLVSLRLTGFFARKNWILLGSLTYPLYLIHQNIGFMIFNTLYPNFSAYSLLLFTIITMLISAYIVHLFERKIANFFKSILESNNKGKKKKEPKIKLQPRAYPL